jgi:hypothetical protein
LDNHRRELIENAARSLDKAKMIRFDERTGYLSPIDVGRIASHFYIKYDTIEVLYMAQFVSRRSVRTDTYCIIVQDLPIKLALSCTSNCSIFL